tara:strand:- start:271 stop:1158 length:888 start_codon:yes stop_codon:yes gene_type:complete
MQTNTAEVLRELPAKFAIPESANFDVGLRPIYDVDHKEISDKKQVFRKDTNDGLAVVSKTYKIRSYEKAINHFNELILHSNLDLNEVEIIDTVDNNGAVFIRNYWFNRIKGIKMFDNPMERSILGLQFKSSHNLLFAEDLLLWARYLFCDNGCSNEDWKLHVRTKHNTTKDIEMDYTALDGAIENFLQGEEEKKKWLEKSIDLWTVKSLFKTTLAFTQKDSETKAWYSDITMNTLNALYVKYSARYGHNMFAVFQTATDWSTHVETKGKVYNVQNRRNARVHDMMKHEIWMDKLN